MKLKEAREQADKLASGGLSGTASCSKPETGIIAIVYRDDTDDAIEGATVKFTSEKATDVAKQSSQDSFEQDVTTTAEGIAKLAGFAGAFSVVVTLTDTDDLFVVKTANQQVDEGKCPVVAIAVHVLARPEVVLTWTHDSKGIEGVAVQLGDHSFASKTGMDGKASWSGKAIERGRYEWALAFGDGGKYELFGNDSKPLQSLEVDIPPGKSQAALRARALKPITLKVMHDAKALDGAKVNIKWPDGGEVREVKPGETKDIPAVDGPATKLAIESIEIAGDDVYELVEVTS
ncbi:MAG TPA: hypothetical protein VEU30_06650 [Thermoanaerobaculia bacterium]|nr:hypothetical protein [Thermoanaerobaculia bacterium]